MREEWKDIPGFEGRYLASTEGRIKSLLRRKERILSQQCSGITRGYCFVSLMPRERPKNLHRKTWTGERWAVHRLVLITFIGECPDGYETLHENDCRSDNRLRNLRWGTHMDNENGKDARGRRPKGSKHGMAILSEEDVIKIRSRKRRPFILYELAAQFGVSPLTVKDIRKGYGWKHLLDSQSS